MCLDWSSLKILVNMKILSSLGSVLVFVVLLELQGKLAGFRHPFGPTLISYGVHFLELSV